MLEGILSNIGKGPAATLASSANNVKSALLEQYSLLSKQMGDQLATYEANFCTPGKFTPGKHTRPSQGRGTAAAHRVVAQSLARLPVLLLWGFVHQHLCF